MHIYIHIYIQAYIYTYIRTYTHNIHTYIHTDIRTYTHNIHTYIHTDIRTYTHNIHTYIHTYTHTNIHTYAYTYDTIKHNFISYQRHMGRIHCNYWLSFLFSWIACGCSIEGSLSSSCKRDSGQCRCKPSIDGRTCSECRKGFSGFPICNCKSKAFLLSARCLAKNKFFIGRFALTPKTFSLMKNTISLGTQCYFISAFWNIFFE